MVMGRGFVASHSAPGAVLTRQDIIERSPKAFTALAWTNNWDWQEGGAQRDILRKNLEVLRVPAHSRWLVGHCKVEKALYRSQFGGQLIQINPREAQVYVVAIVPADGHFLPERDVITVS